MKNTLLLILAVMSLTITIQAKNMSAQLTVSYLGHADSGFREIYGSGGIQPGLRFEAVVWKDFSLYAAYGYFSKKGTTPVLEEEAKTTQHFISVGPVWQRQLSEKLSWNIYAGLLVVVFREEALGETIKDNAVGLEVGGGIRYRLSAKLFLSPSVSYLLANDTVESTEVKLGGVKAGVGLGIRF
jgi:opacity protein-like surface antigen